MRGWRLGISVGAALAGANPRGGLGPAKRSMSGKIIYSWFPCPCRRRTHVFSAVPGPRRSGVTCPECGAPIGELLTDGAAPILLGSTDGEFPAGSSYDYFVLPRPLYDVVARSRP